MQGNKNKSIEELRLEEKHEGPVFPWHKWGPYVAERSWGTVREDYSANGDAWEHFTHDLAPSKVYRWGEDGLASWCDRYQVLVFSPVFWNGKDGILKERLFGLNSTEGNHGEDVKELYYYLDATPTHSYMKYLYKYPQEEFPYRKLREENRNRGAHDPEYELIDTGVFAENRYFDIFIEYAKASSEDLCIRIEAHNRSDNPAPLHLLPHLWFRNQWAWKDVRDPEPKICKGFNENALCLVADEADMQPPSNLSFEYRLGKRYLYGPKGAEVLLTNNETKHGPDSPEFGKGYHKDGFHRKIIHGEDTINPNDVGTKACLKYTFANVAPKSSVVLYLRLIDKEMANPLEAIEEIFEKRRKEADEFYDNIHPSNATEDEKRIQRQALAGILWSKQIYLFDVDLWLRGDNPLFPPPASRLQIRNIHWRHLNSMRILCMPDKWEYPYFCAWDQAYHCVTLGLVDISLAKEQLWLLLFDQFQHPNGDIPACEWEFSDMNPPIQGWAALRLYKMEKERHGRADRKFLEMCFQKLLMNFAWWVNKVDSSGYNVFEGGFLGLDNIAVLDRSRRLGGGVKLHQSDGTGWMAMFCLNLMRIALELAVDNSIYEGLATKFFQHFVYIAEAMKKRDNQKYELWSDKDQFFYDVLTYPNGTYAKFRVRSLVGIIPLYAVDILEEEEMKKFPQFHTNFHWFIKNRKVLSSHCILPITREGKTKYVLSLMTQDHLQSVLKYAWNPQEFRSEFGLRSLSKFHEKHPFVFEDKTVGYEPGESILKIKGGNSNWRGPIWIQMTFLLIDSLRMLSSAFHEDIKIQIGEESPVTLREMSDSFANRVVRIFSLNEQGERPFWGPEFPFKKDPHFRNYIQFYEFFHPETGKGLGASHQTGWSALVANLLDERKK